jgi:hypothetical protein
MKKTDRLFPPQLRKRSAGFTSEISGFLVVLCLSAFLLHAEDLSGQSEERSVSVLESFDFSSEGGVRVELPGELREISGLAVTKDGRIFGHNDEFGRVFEIDVPTGSIKKFFNVGRFAVPGDFEGLAVVGERFFLLTSAGDLVEFREGGNGSSMAYQVYPLGLGRLCEMEGLAFEEPRNALLLPCKTPRTRRLEDHLVVFSVPLTSMTPDPEPRIFLPLEELDSAGLGKNFQPSSIEVHPETGSLFLVAARQEAIVELSSKGEILATKELKKKRHPQPEGITFLPDGRLVIADEGQGGRGTLTFYPRTAGSGEGTP